MEADPVVHGVISGSFPKLRQLGQSFQAANEGPLRSEDEERVLLQLACELGATALPLCHRHFAGEDDRRAAWAHELLFHLGRDVRLRGRVEAELGALVGRATVSERTKLRALALLAELAADSPAAEELSDPEATACSSSSRQLALCLDTPAEVARAGDRLLDQLSIDELLELFDHLVEAEPGSALVLLDELLVRDELDDDSRHELRRRRTAACQLAPAAARLRPRRRSRSALSCRTAHHADGRTVLLATDRQPCCRPRRHRALCVLLAADEVLLDGHYAEDLTANAVEQELDAPLERAGFALAPVTLDEARGLLIRGARLAMRAGRALPRAFYLGRHLLGLADEHLDGTARSPAAIDLAALLDRAILLVASGEPGQALPLLERYLAEAPDDAEGHAQAGLCHLGLGDTARALAHLGRATWLVPEEPLYHWNSAAAAHRSGHIGACYLALEAYCKTRDLAPGAEERRRIAEAFAAEYARLAVLENPGSSPGAVASAEVGRRGTGRSRARHRQRG